MKKDLTSEEILKLPQEEFLKYMRQVQNRTRKKNFVDSLPSDYIELSFEEKVKFWAENLNQGMRLQVEKGYDEYLVFSPEWHNTFQEIEANADKIMDEVFRVFSKYDWPWDKQEYLKRISGGE